jgi:hypothetical protein
LGSVTGIVNTGVMVGALTLMPAIGLVLDARWLGALVNGVRQYPLDAFWFGWRVLAGWMTISAMLLLTRETNASPSA